MQNDDVRILKSGMDTKIIGGIAILLMTGGIDYYQYRILGYAALRASLNKTFIVYIFGVFVIALLIRCIITGPSALRLSPYGFRAAYSFLKYE